MPRPSKTLLIATAGVGLLLSLGGGLALSWQSALHDSEVVITRPTPTLTATNGTSSISAETTPQKEGVASSSLSTESTSLGDESSTSSTVGTATLSSQATSAESSAEKSPSGPQVVIPAVFGASQGIYTNAAMADGLSEIAEQFAEKVKQGGWDTTSASYQSNWSNAAAEADALLRARYGVQAFQQLQHEAAAP